MSLIQHVQSGSSGLTNVATVAATGAGRLITAIVAIDDTVGGTLSVASISDGTSNFVHDVARDTTASNGSRLEHWYLLSSNAGKTTITATLSGTGTGWDLYIDEFDGATTWALDAADFLPDTTGSGTTYAGKAVTPSAPVCGVGGYVGGSTISSNPAVGNEFNAGGDIGTNANSACVAILTASATSHQPVWTGAVGGAQYCSITAFFKDASAAAPPPRIGKPLLEEVRAQFKVRSRVALLRERGKGWFQAIFPAMFPIRNTALVPAKWIVLTSRIGATAIQRATTGVIAAIVGGRVGGERRAQRSIAARGRALAKVGIQMRVPTGTPAKWTLLGSLIGSATIQRATTGVVAAMLAGRDHADKLLARKLLATGRAFARRWLPPPPSAPAPRITNAVALGRVHGGRSAARRARSSGRALAQRWLPAPPTPPSPKPITCVVMGRSRSEHLKTVRQATIVAYDVAFLILPQPNTPALPGADGLTIVARADRTARVKRQHDRASAPIWAPRPAPIIVNPPLQGADGITVTLRADRSRRPKMQHDRASSSSWAPPVRLPLPFPPLPLPRRMMAEHRTAWAHRAHARHEQHASFAGTQILLGQRIPPAPPPIVVDDRRRRWRGAAW